jgi:ATP-dependent helicase/nuclease subunit B
LASKYDLVGHPGHEDESPSESREGGYRPRGLLLAETFEALDGTLEKGRSAEYNFFRKENGEMGYPDSSDGAEYAQFQKTLEHTRAKLGELADGILDGNVAVRPYRLGTYSPCSWCPMASVCRFEMGISEVRFLESLKRSEVFRRLNAAGT